MLALLVPGVGMGGSDPVMAPARVAGAAVSLTLADGASSSRTAAGGSVASTTSVTGTVSIP